jgi:hypothetical protein
VTYAWSQGQVLRRLPATMALYAGILGAWAAGDADLIRDLLRQSLRHSYIDANGEIQELPSSPAFVALAPPEVIDIDALGLGPGAYHATNKVVEAIMPVLKDEFPVDPDFSDALEEAEYLMALLQHNWHDATGHPGHQRWAQKTFHSGLIAIPGTVVSPQPESVISRFDSNPGGLDIHSFSGMFQGDEQSMSHAIAAVTEYVKGVSGR